MSLKIVSQPWWHSCRDYFPLLLNKFYNRPSAHMLRHLLINRVQTLHKAGKTSRALESIETFLEEQYGENPTRRHERLTDQKPAFPAQFLAIYSLLLFERRGAQSSISAFHTFLDHHDPEDSARFVEKLHRKFACYDISLVNHLLQGYVGLLVMEGEYEVGLAHLEAFVELHPEAYQRSEVLVALVSTGLQDFDPTMAFDYIGKLVSLLAIVGRYQDGLIITSAYLGIDAHPWESRRPLPEWDSELIYRFHKKTRRLLPPSKATYLIPLFRCLVGKG